MTAVEDMRSAVAVVIQELEGDVMEARTRDESVRLSRRVLRLRQIIGVSMNHADPVSDVPSGDEPDVVGVAASGAALARSTQGS